MFFERIGRRDSSIKFGISSRGGNKTTGILIRWFLSVDTFTEKELVCPGQFFDICLVIG